MDIAHSYFQNRGVASDFVERPFQGRTLNVSDDAGTPLEFVAHMPIQARMHDQYQIHKGAGALRFDHTQVLVPDPKATSRFYLDLGFRVSDWFVRDETDDQPVGVFLYRKQNPHDIVFLKRPGPVLHHFAYIVQDQGQLFRALDIAGNLGFASAIERGPARHGEGHALYVYFRDPDGHRVEILTHPVMIGDADDAPMKWHRGNRRSWEYPAPKSWLYEGTIFENVPVAGLETQADLPSLEDALAQKILKVPGKLG